MRGNVLFLFLILFISIGLACSKNQPEKNVEQSGAVAFGTVAGMIINGGDGQPIPARVYVIGSDDSVYMADVCVPYEKPSYIKNIGYTGRHFTTKGNSFTVHLPAGPARIIIERGKEYIPIVETLNVSPGKTITKEFTIKRWIYMASKGWYSGDLHVHRRLSELADLMIVEDLNITLPQTVWGHNREPELDIWLDKADASGIIKIDGHHMFSVLSHEIERFSASAILMHHTGKTFLPVHEHDNRSPTNLSLMEETHAAGGYVDLEKATWPESHIDISAGKADFVGLLNNHYTYKKYLPEHPRRRTEFKDNYPDGVRGYTYYVCDIYYAYLNCGFKAMPSAGSASGVLPNPLGYNRVYAKVEGDLSYDGWFEALKAGHSFATNGPMLIMTVNGAQMGETIDLKDSDGSSVQVKCEIHSLKPIERLDIIRDGECVHSVSPQLKDYSAVVEADVSFSESGWIAARCFEKNEETDRFAHTSPVFINIAGKPFKPKKYAVSYFLEKTNDLIKDAEKDEFESEEARKATMDAYRKALTIYNDLHVKSR